MFDTIDMTDEGGVGTWIAPRHERDGHPSDNGRLVSRADRLHASIGAAIRELFALLLEIERTGAWEADGARDVTHWVQIRYGVSGWKAHRWVDAARVLERLPQTAAALASGRLGVDKIVELTRFAAPETERGLLAWAGTVSSGAIRRRVELETRRPAESAADADAERRLRWWFTDEGRRMELMAELPADAGAVVARAIDAVAQDLPEMPEGDRAETIDARRADALVALCDGAVVASARLTETDGVARTAHQKVLARRIRPRIVVHAQLSALTGRADGANAEIEVASGSAAGVIGPPTLRRLACDAEFQVVVEDGDGEPLHLGRTAREPSAAIARLIRHRDRECRFPACGARRFTETHHVEWWSRGGTTDVSNLVFLCGFHHRLVHEHGWGLRRRAGGQVTWTRPDGSRFRSGPSPPSCGSSRRSRPPRLSRASGSAARARPPPSRPSPLLERERARVDREEAAVDGERRAGHVGGVVAREEGDACGDLFGVRSTAQRDRRRRELVGLVDRAARIEELRQRVVAHLGADPPRADGVRADASRREVHGDRGRESDQGGLRGDVGGARRRRDDPRDRRHQDDRRARTFRERRDGRADEPHRAGDVDVERALPTLVGDVGDGAAEPDAGVRDDDVDRSEPIERTGDDRVGARGSGHVCRDGEPAGRVGDGAQRFLAPSGDDDRGTLSAEPPGGGRTDAGAPARHDRDLPLEPHRALVWRVGRRIATAEGSRRGGDGVANMDPLRREDLPELEALFRHYDETLSFVPNSLFTMARRPEILAAFSELITQIWNTGTLPKALKPLIAIVSSVVAGCRYCQAHEAVDARERGVADERIAAIWDFERSDLFTDAERAALRFARDASLVPNLVTPAHFEELRQHWDDGQVVEMLAVIGLFGFLNRWNDTMATDLEPEPFAFAGARYGGNWEPGKHDGSVPYGSPDGPALDGTVNGTGGSTASPNP